MTIPTHTTTTSTTREPRISTTITTPEDYSITSNNYQEQDRATTRTKASHLEVISTRSA